MIGLPRKNVTLVPYNPDWKDEYKKEENLLYQTIGSYIIDIQHVGSTSIEGLASKPIIDIAVGVKSFDSIDIIKQLLETLGYFYRPDTGIAERFFFAKGGEEARTHYLHVELYNGTVWKNHIYFRDYLICHRGFVEQYSNLKAKLAERFKEDRVLYTAAKNEFIRMIIEMAKKEST